jgi:type II secretion system protein H
MMPSKPSSNPRLCPPAHPSARRPRRDATKGFTLIEIIAVVAIMGMVFAIGIPRLSSSKWRVLRAQAESIASSLEFARQRSVMTGISHRVFIDLEEGGYRIEWLVSEQRAFAALSDSDIDDFGSAFAAGAATGDGESIDLRPPAREERDFYPIANRQLGSFTWLDDALYFVGLESSAGWIEGGSVEIVFDPDGTTEYSRLEIADSDENHMTLEIEPLLDRVRRREGRARS